MQHSFIFRNKELYMQKRTVKCYIWFDCMCGCSLCVSVSVSVCLSFSVFYPIMTFGVESIHPASSIHLSSHGHLCLCVLWMCCELLSSSWVHLTQATVFTDLLTHTHMHMLDTHTHTHALLDAHTCTCWMHASGGEAGTHAHVRTTYITHIHQYTWTLTHAVTHMAHTAYYMCHILGCHIFGWYFNCFLRLST